MCSAGVFFHQATVGPPVKRHFNLNGVLLAGRCFLAFRCLLGCTCTRSSEFINLL